MLSKLFPCHNVNLPCKVNCQLEAKNDYWRQTKTIENVAFAHAQKEEPFPYKASLL